MGTAGESTAQPSRDSAHSSRRRFLGAALAATSGLAGCAQQSARPILVFTDWSDAEWAELAATLGSIKFDVAHAWMFRPWRAFDGVPLGTQLVVGWSPIQHAIAAQQTPCVWRAMAPARWGLASVGDPPTVPPASLSALGAPEWLGRLVLPDFTRDWATHALLCDELMGSLDFQATYARWLRLYGNAEAIEPTATAALARLRPRGPSTHAALCGESTARALGRAFVPLDQPLTTQLGCVLPTAASQSDALLQVIEPITSGDTGRRGAIDLSDILSIDLLVDLMKCVIIDARVELSMAAQALAGSVGEFSTRAERAFVEPPPWPPASIVELRKKPQGPGLIDSLLTQLTPDVSARRWLGVSWDRPPAPLDSASVRALASAEGGALLTAPRIRAWLRAEWAAWARQRFRRVARLARGRLTP